MLHRELKWEIPIVFNTIKSNKRLWELFTKKEEYSPSLLDQYQRFPYYFSRHRDILEPEVSAFLIQNGLKVKYPDNKRFAVCLTHDVDAIHIPGWRIVYESTQALLKRQVGKSFKMLLSKFNRKLNPLWHLEKIVDLEARYGAKSSFYFLALQKNDLDFNYRISELNRELRGIADSGWEVGLHGGYEAYNNLNQIKKEKERLESVIGKKVIGYRNHYLGFKVPTTWELLKKAGFKYDTTFGYADCVGFRNGMCHPFKPFNLHKNEYIDILEIPLIIMDETLTNYMRLDAKQAWEITKQLVDTVEKYHGIMTVLWHAGMYDVKLELYERLLSYCQEKNAWMTSGEEIWREMG